MLNLPVSFSAFFLIRQIGRQGLFFLIYVTLFPDRFQHGAIFFERLPYPAIFKRETRRRCAAPKSNAFALTPI